MEKTVYVVLPVFNRLDSTKRFLASLDKQTFRNFEVVICDDGSTDGTAEFLRAHYPSVKVLHGTGDLWWTAGINRCIRDVLSRCHDNDYILTINNDNTLPDNYLQQKMDRANEHPDTIIGSLCVYADNPNTIETSGYVLGANSYTTKTLDRTGSHRTATHKGIRRASHLPGKGVLLPVAVYKRVGLYDEENLPQYHADTDLTLRAHKAGFPVIVDYDSLVFSEVNTQNMVLPGQSMSLRDIIKTFKGPYSMNNFRIYNYFAKKHFPEQRFRYLIKQYTKTCLGLLRRYALSKLRVLTGK